VVEPPTQSYVLATWTDRALAYLLDLLLLLLLEVPFAGLAVLLLEKLYLQVAVTFLPLLIIIVLSSRRGAHNGQTLGKQICGIRVIRNNNRPVGVGTVLVREVARAILWALPLIDLIDIFLPAFDSDKLSMHDIIARTHVVSSQTTSPFALGAFSPGGISGRQEAAANFMATKERDRALARTRAQAVAAASRELGELAVGEHGFIIAPRIFRSRDNSLWVSAKVDVSAASNQLQRLALTRTQAGVEVADDCSRVLRGTVSAASYRDLGWLPVTATL
jgi:uncharacterized RDD family membrane protein YckC